jgi:predicted peptidase
MRADYPTFVMVGEAEAPFDWAATGVFAEKKRPEKLPVLLETVHALLSTEAIDPARIYITGQSLGGIGSWGAIARDPALFAAAVPVCGAWSVDDAPKMAAVPVWAFHGADDRTVPVHFSRDLTAAITKAGGAAKYTEYPGVGHNSWLRAYEEPEMWAWLFAQHKTAPKN